MVKLVFVDMDGTFLTSEKTITSENARILDVAYEHGVQFVPCSGRNMRDLPQELVNHPSVHYAVCCNGALIVEARSREVMREITIDKSLVRELYETARDLRVTFDIFADGRVYTERSRFPLIDTVGLSAPTRAFIKAGRTVFDGPMDDLLDRVGEICRLNVFYHTIEERNRIWEAVDACSDLRRTNSLPCNIEITNVHAHKGAGVEWLCEKLGLSPLDAIAFGDNDNDITMLQAVGDGVAMENADPVCKAAANHLTESCENSGVARYLAPIFKVRL
jgi:Cof subfamily protein (haloacid dehalogenase superfamily)